MKVTASERSLHKIVIIDLLRFLACLMIFFYHCNTILPGAFKWLTFFGEDMGNDLFFMISGFALYPSIGRTPLKGFPEWYLKRLARILPMLALAYIASFISGYYSLSDPAQVFTVFIYPTLYWFATGILVFYILLFFLMKIRPLAVRYTVVLAVALLWAVRSDRMEGYYLIGFVAMAAGCLLRAILETGAPEKAKKYIGLCLAAFASYMAFKSLIFAGDRRRLFLIATGISVLVFGGMVLTAGYIRNSDLIRIFEGRERLYKLIGYVGKLALPVYLVQCFNAGLIGFTISQRISFPLSFAVNLLLVWGGAVALERIQTLIVRLASHRKNA